MLSSYWYSYCSHLSCRQANVKAGNVIANFMGTELGGDTLENKLWSAVSIILHASVKALKKRGENAHYYLEACKGFDKLSQNKSPLFCNISMYKRLYRGIVFLRVAGPSESMAEVRFNNILHNRSLIILEPASVSESKFQPELGIDSRDLRGGKSHTPKHVYSEAHPILCNGA